MPIAEVLTFFSLLPDVSCNATQKKRPKLDNLPPRRQKDNENIAKSLPLLQRKSEKTIEALFRPKLGQDTSTFRKEDSRQSRTG